MNKYTKLIKRGLILLPFIIFFPGNFISAASPSFDDSFIDLNFFDLNGGGLFVSDSAGNVNLVATIANVINVIFIFVIIIALGMGLYGGFVYVTSSDNDERLEEAKSILKNAIIGIIIAVLGSIIVTALASITGFNADLDIDDATSPDPSPPVRTIEDCLADPDGCNVDDFL